MEEKIMTLHPKGKNGVHILRRRYDQIAEYLLKVIERRKQISYAELDDLAVAELTDKFDGKVSWYVVTVKLDLEARGIIKRIPNTSPHEVALA